jgi:tripartite-type tricarboxylate transporter receptor subunit TctC
MTAGGRWLDGLGRVLVMMAVLAAPPAGAHSDSKILKILVPFAAGGAQDIMARHLGPKLAARTGLTVVIENRTGGGGLLAADAVARAGADTPVLLMATGGAISIAPHLHAKLPYDPRQDLQPLALVADTPMTVAVRTDSPLKTLADLAREARAKPGQLSYGSTGHGTVSHLAGALLAQTAGIEWLHVPYRGAAPAMTDLLGGQIHAVVMSAASVDPMADAGKVRVLGTFSRSHLASLGNPPTVAEALKLQGLEVPIWVGLLASARLPAEQARRLSEALVDICRQPDTRQTFAQLGATTTCARPTELGQVITEDSQRWGAVIRKGQIRAE